MLKEDIKQLLFEGTVIPAHPLALNEDRTLDEEGQRRLTNYYMDAGAGGIAVGVHTTQFEIRDPEFNLFERVLQLAVEEVNKKNLTRPFIKIAGICGPVHQAVEEAEIAKDLGYDMGLLSNGGLTALSEDELLERTRKVAEIIPVFGFYLQPSVGGRAFTYEFWKEFAEIPNVYGIKIAPFNRYQTLDVVRAVCHSSRCDEIALYTGNDDNIVNDLLTTYQVNVNGRSVKKQIIGGLLGHWAVWTQKAVVLLEKIKTVRDQDTIPASLLTLAQEVTDSNTAFFDSANSFKGCIAGINEVLARQGLIKGNWCLLDKEKLSPGQEAEIDRIYKDYPHLNDDAFVKQILFESTK
ncbi:MULTISPECIES: dihydrodipicolinate synthase family protein [unclassified Mesobacillus]|uniref:dihydrodipicolinate synthase family protein n=1 Tax=unclassified Mesobacillus TaxID=2675270 RepID=UPI00203C94BD|nr:MULTISPECIES: dihydrodipicolinate synthase family protein [unclassified Mesobacillus]MCM3123834.1 dihydrodipicolinate synthase family protein [Mesobacillus sp. MER 33]MCM3234151.1 dihydrodipicolinate synthase family protein [Mesobacillus sp. MER 48]